MTPDEIRELESSIDRMMELARGFGLDFYDMRFELVPADVLYTFGAYQGMPTRFSHWSFGKAFHRMKMDYDLGLSRIYELVINSDPCYAFLLDSNSLVQNKLVSAHVLAHCDFFKNNMMFHRTSRNVVESMAASAERFRSYELQYGKDEVEAFLDAALALQEHIDPSERAFRHPHTKPDLREEQEQSVRAGKYDDLFALDERLAGREKVDAKKAEDRKAKGFAKDAPQKDLLLFLLSHSKILAEWQRDMLTVIREEMLYFWPQIETKIMNEGWASGYKDAFWRRVSMIQIGASDSGYPGIPNKEAMLERLC